MGKYHTDLRNPNGFRFKSKKCKSLQSYATYVKILRDKQESGLSGVAAVNAAVEEAIRLNLLDGFFKVHRAEVIDMILTEFDQEKYDRNRREETLIETAKNLLNYNVDPEIIANSTYLPLEQVLSLAH